MRKAVSSKEVLFLLALLTLCTCSHEEPSTSGSESSEELRLLFQQDQDARLNPTDKPTGPADLEKRKRVFELLAAGSVNSADDKFHAAVILNHTHLIFCGEEMVSASPENYYLAYRLALESLQMGNENARLLVAQTLDRYLYYSTGVQKYGTQRLIDPETGEEYLAPIDPSVTDQERAEFRVPPLRELLSRYPLQENKHSK